LIADDDRYWPHRATPSPALPHRDLAAVDQAAAVAGAGGGRIARQAPARVEQCRRVIFPAAFLTVTLFALNFLGDGLRDALDPKDR
jgi:hypothetical protein